MDIARSDGVVLLDVDREALGAGQLFAGGDLHVLIGNDAVQLHVGLDHGILHQDTVLDHSTLLDLDAAEEHAVLHGAFDDAAVGQNGIHDLGTGDVTGGVIVADLGVDGAALGEQRFRLRSSISFRFSSK